MNQVLKKQKITIVEWTLLYLVMTYAPATRLISQLTIQKAHQTAWLAPVVSCIVYVPFLAIIVSLMKKFEGKSYYQILCDVFGKIAAKIICTVFLIYLFMLISLYMRYSTNKLVSSIYTGTDFRIFLFFSISFIYIILRSGISTIGRMSKIIFFYLLIQFIIIILMLIPSMKLTNVTPFCSSDIPALFQSSFYVTTITGYISYIFIFNDKITLDKNVTKHIAFTGAFIVAATTVIIFATLAVFGWNVTQHLNYAFLQAVKGISIFKSVSGLEALFLSIWILSEFINVSILLYVIMRLLKGIFNVESELPFFGVLAVFIFFFSQIFFRNVFELLKFSEHVAVYVNNILGIGLPLLVFVVAKIRKAN